MGAALTDNDLTGLDSLAAVDLYAEALGVGVATIARRAKAFLMSHLGTYLSLGAGS
jgi:hypothetical protein